MFFLVLVYVFNFDLFEFSAAILEKGLFGIVCSRTRGERVADATREFRTQSLSDGLVRFSSSFSALPFLTNNYILICSSQLSDNVNGQTAQYEIV